MVLRTLLASLVFYSASLASAEIVTFDVIVEDDNYRPNDTVRWDVFLTVSGSTIDNYGIATAAINLSDSFGELLMPGTIGSRFADYSFTSGGTAAPNGDLIEITSVLFSQNNSIAEAIDGSLVPDSSLGPLLFASGSFQASALGTHTLSATDGSANLFFTSAGQLSGLGTRSFTTRFNSDTFVVSAVPEPGSVIFLTALAGLIVRHKQKRRSSSINPS